MIRKTFTVKGLLLLLALASGCSKEQNDTPTPAANSVGIADAKNVFGWSKFMAEIEAGTRKDPSGQFVSKNTQVPNGDGKSARPTRPKHSQEGDVTTNYVAPIGEDNGGGGGPYEPPTAFFSSEGRGLNLNSVENPNDYILNLDIVTSAGTTYNAPPRQGFQIIPLDLNKGAGGKAIYLCYTRQSSGIAMIRDYNPEGGLTGSNTSAAYCAKQPITGLGVVIQSFWGATTNPVRDTGYDWVSEYTGGWPTYWDNTDLNDEAGGKYVTAIFTKGIPTSGAIYGLPQRPIKEVGVIYSTNKYVPNPLGWELIRRDLNEDAGGYYIYLCYRY